MNKKKYVCHKKESGVLAIDEVSCIFVILFTFLMIYVCACYVKMTQMRMEIDSIGRQYLYRMEADGYLTNEDRTLMIEDLVLIGVKRESINFQGTTINQAPYGSKVTLSCSVAFDNPICAVLSNRNSIFHMTGLQETITHVIEMSATAKW